MVKTKLGKYILKNNDEKKIQYLYLIGLVFPLLTFILMFFVENNVYLKIYDSSLNNYEVTLVNSFNLSKYFFQASYSIVFGLFSILFLVSGLTFLILEIVVPKFQKNVLFKTLKFMFMFLYYFILLTGFMCFDVIYVSSFLYSNAAYYSQFNSLNYTFGIFAVLGIIYEAVVYTIKYNIFNNKNIKFDPIVENKVELTQQEKDEIEFISFDKDNDDKKE